MKVSDVHSLISEVFLLFYDLALQKRQHSVAAAEGEQPYDKENPEKLEDKSKLSHF